MDLAKMKLLMAKKKQNEGEDSESMSELEKHAKMNVVKHMRDMASDGLTDKLKNLHKVTVAGNNKEALEMGLAKAREMVGADPETGGDSMEEKEESPEHEASETPEMEAAEHECDESCDHSEESSPEQESIQSKYSDMHPNELEKHLEALMVAKEKHNNKY